MQINALQYMELSVMFVYLMKVDQWLGLLCLFGCLSAMVTLKTNLTSETTKSYIILRKFHFSYVIFF